MSRLRCKASKDHHHVQKSWGSEEWVVNNSWYCGKVLRFNKGQSTSLHFHLDKHETMYVLDGSFEMQLSDPETGEEYTLYLNAGESLEIPRGQPHRIVGQSFVSVLVEFSTTHYDEDSYRVRR